MSEWTIFGERLSHIMREYDVSIRELSRRTGITLTTLHRYATCKRVPKATEILKCANALGITCDYLLGLSDDPHLTGKGEQIKDNNLPTIQPEPQWIPVSERFPEDLEEVNVTWVNRNPESYYESIKDKPFTATAVYYKEKWYWWSTYTQDLLAEYGERCNVGLLHEAIEITAWMPLPEPYKPNK